MLIPGFVMAQVVIDQDTPVLDLVNDFLLGDGIVANNVTVTGFEDQIGEFLDNGSWGLDSGLVLCTGPVSTLEVGNDYGNGNFDFTGDDDLLAVANEVPPLIGQGFTVASVNDVVYLEFDFIPYGDSLAFNYVFASEEYPAWVNSSFNDVFAFFVSGPGIEGPYSSPAEFNGSVNIATVPDSDPPLPITISSVNDNLNSELYTTEDIDGVVQYINGRTIALSASIGDLQIGETYHIRFGIADGTDAALQTAIFLQAGSFTAFNIVDPNTPGDFDGDFVVDIDDLLVILGDLGCQGLDCVADLNGDGLVNILDILMFLELF